MSTVKRYTVLITLSIVSAIAGAFVSNKVTEHLEIKRLNKEAAELKIENDRHDELFDLEMRLKNYVDECFKYQAKLAAEAKAKEVEKK